MTLIVLLVVASVTAAFVVVRGWTSNAGARTPEGAVRGFLTAVARGDSAQALRFQQTQPISRVLLNDAVLDRARSFAPITDIRIEPPTDGTTVVGTHFRVGGEEVHTAWPVARQGDHTWKVVRGTTPITMTFPGNLPVLIDGVRLGAAESEVFPGRHRLGTGLPALDYHPGETILATGTQPIHLAPTPALTEAGRAAVIDAAREAWQNCLRQRSLSPPSCPQNVRSGDAIRFDPATITWTSEDEPFGEISPSLVFEDATRAEFPVRARLRLRVWATRDGYGNEVKQEVEINTTATAHLLDDPIRVEFGK